MLNSPKCAAVAVVSVIGLAAGAAGALADGCETYGKLALQQQKENESRKCGFTGAEWSSDLKAHIAWCAGVSPQEWQAKLQGRKQQLDECKSKS
jgi:hypothetical protein